MNYQFGEILGASHGEIVIACGNETALQVLELQIEGKRRMSASDFLNGIKIEAGETLG